MYSTNKSFIVAATLLLALSAAPANAQGIKDLRKTVPLELMPQPAEKADAPPIEQPPMMNEMATAEEGMGDIDEVYSTPAEEVKPTPVTIPADTAITMTPATNISLDTLGVYDAKSGGLAFKVWDGSSHKRVRSLLENMPQTVPSPTVRHLVARLLLSSTQPPESQNIQQTIFKQRIQTLMHIDEVAQAQRLAEMVPQNLHTEQTAHLLYTTHLLKGDSDWVCSNIGAALQKYNAENGYWQKLSIFCNAQANDVAKAQLGLDLLSEQQVDIDPGFTSLIDVMLGRNSKITKRYSNPLSLDDAAIIAISGKDAFPADYLKTAPLPVVRLVKDNTGFADAIKSQAEQRLKGAIALEKPNKDREKMREWFEKQFADSPEKAVNFDSETKQMQSKGGSAGEPRDTRRQYRFYTMLQALGFSNISANEPWKNATFKDAGRIHVSPALRSEMASAVDSELTGEAILLLAMAAGQVDDLADVDDASIADMVQALMQLGYGDEAQALAAEAMTALY